MVTSLVTLFDLHAAVQAAMHHPASQMQALGHQTFRDLGQGALDALSQKSTRSLLIFLQSASVTELEHGIDAGWKYAHDLALRFRDEVTAVRDCGECGTVAGRPCTVTLMNGTPLQVAWVHEARIGVEVVA